METFIFVGVWSLGAHSAIRAEMQRTGGSWDLNFTSVWKWGCKIISWARQCAHRTILFFDFLGCHDAFKTTQTVQVFLFHAEPQPISLSLQDEHWWNLLKLKWELQCLPQPACLLGCAFPVRWWPCWQVSLPLNYEQHLDEKLLAYL